MFALLEHNSPDGVHWDLLIEKSPGERLPTWRLAHNPIGAPGPVAAERIGEHRRLYLEYEGPISGGRGEVRRLDRGEATILAWADDRVRVELHGAMLRGAFELARAGSGWNMARLSD